MNNLDLAEKIDLFLTQYADIKPDYDPEFDDEEDKFTSPDASELALVSKLIKEQLVVPKDLTVHSNWGSGGYSPYTSDEGQKKHNEILKEVGIFLKSENKNQIVRKKNFNI